MSLTGKSYGESRADIIQKAKAIAATYYGTECVAVEVSGEECETDIVTHADYERTIRSDETTTFSAAWSANESHRWEQPAYGFAKCVYCERKRP